MIDDQQHRLNKETLRASRKNIKLSMKMLDLHAEVR